MYAWLQACRVLKWKREADVIYRLIWYAVHFLTDTQKSCKSEYSHHAEFIHRAAIAWKWMIAILLHAPTSQNFLSKTGAVANSHAC